MAEEETVAGKPPLGARLRRAGLFVMFVAVLLIPKALALRRQRAVWNTLRLAAALLGGALLWIGRSGGDWPAVLAGGLLVLGALAVPPARVEKSVDEQARALGALVVLNGGRFRGPGGTAKATRLFVGGERLHVLDLAHRPLWEISLSEVTRVRAEESGKADPSPPPGMTPGWCLTVEWEGGSALFVFEGFFAEHLARVAETTLRDRLRRDLPVVK